MPLYEYECDACGARFELIRRFSDPPVEACERCGKGPVRRLMSSPAIQFKGSGWYITDYAQKGKSEKPAGEKSADASGADAKTADGKAAGAGDAAKTEAPPAKTAPAKAQGTSQKSQGTGSKSD